MRHFRNLVIAAVLAAAPVAAHAETPADTLVIADKIDDVVSLDPAESFEFSGNDALNNVYNTLIEIDPKNLEELTPGLAESWSVSDDGKTYTFKIRQGIKFHSGNPVTAEDAAFSLQRAVKLGKTPSFILTQFGFTADNVEQMIKATSDTELQITTDKAYAQSFFYNILTSVVSSIVDKKEVMAHEANGDLGYEWLKTHSAGSGPFMLRSWKPSDSIVLEAPEGDYWMGERAMKRVYVRHVAEPSAQRLLLEKGDIDIARKLTPGDIEAVAKNPDISILEEQRGRIFYLAANQKNEALAKPQVMQAIKYLIDYDGMANSFLKGQSVVHQAFLPLGFLGAIKDNPFKLDVEKAKGLLKEAGYPDGFAVTLHVRNDQKRMDMAQSIQSTLAQAGIKATLKTGTGSEILGDYRARKHELILEAWGPDYPDPHTNADTFAKNPDNSDEAKLTGVLAWRNAYAAEKTTPMVEAAVVEQDTGKRRAMYEEIQHIAQQESPFACLFQDVEQVAMRKNVSGFSTGAAVSSAYYWPVKKQ